MTEPRQIRLLMELRTLGVGDAKVLAAIERVPREAFVPQQFIDQAYENTALPIGEGQTISQPIVVALMTQALDIDKRMKVLEVGTGSGYQTAVLSRLARRVYTIERHANLLVQAEKLLHQLRISNYTAKAGDGSKGWPEQAPFPRILVTAAATKMPEPLIEQLEVGGKMVIPLGERSSVQSVMRVTRTETSYTTENLFPVRFVPLVRDEPQRPRTGS